jgi:hypothetical protein
MAHVSIERICTDCSIVRYHDSGGGLESPASFFVVVALDADGLWWFKAAWGTYSVQKSRRIRRALSDAGFPAVHRLSGWGDRERVIKTKALPCSCPVPAC